MAALDFRRADAGQRGEDALMNWLLYIVAGAVSGVLSGMGIGGGVLLIPALVLLGGVAQHSAQGINLLYFLPTAMGALWILVKRGNWKRKCCRC